MSVRKPTREQTAVDDVLVCCNVLLVICTHGYEFEKTASACFPRAYNLRPWKFVLTAKCRLVLATDAIKLLL